MSRSLLPFLLPAVLAGTASADLVLGTFDTPAADSSTVRRVYHAEAYSNPASKRDLEVGADGALTLTVTLAADAGKDYSALAGILVPINSLWAPKDIREATAITFRIKGSSTYNVNFALGSDTYPYSDHGLVMVAPLQVNTTWTRQTIPLKPTPALAWLSWMEDEDRFPGGTVASVIMDSSDPNYNDETWNVAMTIKNIQFQIFPSWQTATNWTAPAAGPTSLSVDDIVVVGMDRYPEVHGRGCKAGRPSVVYSDLKSRTNEIGAGWYAYTDTGASGLAKGSSSIVLPEGAKAWTIDTALAEAPFVANLERSAVNRRAAFAGIGFRVPPETYLDLTGLEAIGFTLDVPSGASIDPIRGAGVHFKVGMLSVGDSATHEVMIPVKQFAAGRTEICVDVGSLKMPDRMLTQPDYRVFSPEYVEKLAWEIQLEDSSNAFLYASNQGFTVGPVILYGLTAIPDPVSMDASDNWGDVIWGPGWEWRLPVERRPGRQPFAVSYRSGQLSLQGLDGYASLEIRTLTGTRVATLAPSASVRIRLDRGTYLLVARGEGKPALSRTLAVAR